MSLENFEIALRFLLPSESADENNSKGYSDNFGVSQSAYDFYRKGQALPPQSVENITKDEAVNLYYENYWKLSGADDLEDTNFAVLLFNTAVRYGVDTAKRFYKESNGDFDKFLEIRRQSSNSSVTNNQSQTMSNDGLSKRIENFGQKPVNKVFGQTQNNEKVTESLTRPVAQNNNSVNKPNDVEVPKSEINNSENVKQYISKRESGSEQDSLSAHSDNNAVSAGTKEISDKYKNIPKENLPNIFKSQDDIQDSDKSKTETTNLSKNESEVVPKAEEPELNSDASTDINSELLNSAEIMSEALPIKEQNDANADNSENQSGLPNNLSEIAKNHIPYSYDVTGQSIHPFNQKEKNINSLNLAQNNTNNQLEQIQEQLDYHEKVANIYNHPLLTEFYLEKPVRKIIASFLQDYCIMAGIDYDKK